MSDQRHLCPGQQMIEAIWDCFENSLSPPPLDFQWIWKLVQGQKLSRPSKLWPMVRLMSSIVTIDRSADVGLGLANADTFQIASNGSGGIILDSGNTVTEIVDAAFTPFTDILMPLITYPLLNKSDTGDLICYNISGVTNLPESGLSVWKSRSKSTARQLVFDIVLAAEHRHSLSHRRQ